MKQEQLHVAPRNTRGRRTHEEMAAALKAFDEGAPAVEVCRRYGVSSATFYKWRAARDGRRVASGRTLSGESERSGLGRPARINTDAIVKATLEIGLEHATVRNVAAALGMSFTGLYHHVKTRSQLLELVADSALSAIIDEPSASENFEEQVIYYARKFYDIFVQYPSIISSSLAGYAMYTDRVIPIHEQLFAAGIRSGFSVSEAYTIFMNAMSAVNGAAVMEIAERAMNGKEGHFLTKLQSSIESQHRHSPLLSALVAAERGKKTDFFQAVLVTISGSIANVRAGHAGNVGR